MSSPLLLDGLLILVVLLFIPIGLWRGGVREAIVAGGILLGGALADAWARPWGDDLATQLDLRPQAARFVVALALLLGATLCVGYGGGAALRSGIPGPLGRIGGALLAGLNGLLLLGYGLGFLDQYVLERTSVPMLSDSFVARFLLQQFGWLLLALIFVIMLVILAAAASPAGRGDFVDEPVEAVAGDTATVGGSGTRPRPVRVPQSADAGKFEPVHRYGMSPDVGLDTGSRLRDGTTTGLRASDLSMSDRPPTPPLPLRSNPDRLMVPTDAEPVEAGESARTGAVIVDEWLRRAARPSGAPAPDDHQAGDGVRTFSHGEPHTGRDPAAGEDPSPTARQRSDGERSTGRPSLHVVRSSAPNGPEGSGSERAPRHVREPGADPRGALEPRRCRSCNARIDEADAYCSTCGSFVS